MLFSENPFESYITTNLSTLIKNGHSSILTLVAWEAEEWARLHLLSRLSWAFSHQETENSIKGDDLVIVTCPVFMVQKVLPQMKPISNFQRQELGFCLRRMQDHHQKVPKMSRAK